MFFLLIRFKSVAHSSQSYNTFAVFSKAFAQKLDVGVKGSFITEEVITPHLADKFFTGEGKAFVLDHIEEQLILLWSHLNSFAVYGDDSCRKVNRQALVGKHVLFNLSAVFTAV